jgi:hypothetical protein
MKLLDTFQLIRKYAKATSKFCMYISWPEDFLFSELIRAAPYLEKYEQAVFTAIDNSLILVFDTEKEMEHCYNQTVGDDGPTKLNNYIGPTRVYALTYSHEGEMWNENT